MQKISKNIKHTKVLAEDFLNKIKPVKNRATIVGLYGELGTGKTVFTQIVAKMLGIRRKVNSPTFVIMKKYSLFRRSRKDFLAGKKNPVPVGENLSSSAFKYLFHIDAYRLKNEKELLNLGWKEIISKPEHLIFIEWPENVAKAMPKKHHKVLISHTKKGYREFEIK